MMFYVINLLLHYKIKKNELNRLVNYGLLGSIEDSGQRLKFKIPNNWLLILFDILIL
jgi:hypothetical protein